jgi:hypothetical protein
MKGRFIDPAEIVRAYRDPLSWASLGVDLLPIIAVIAFGWSATPLVALYWLENLVIGVFTVARMIGTVFASIGNLLGALFMAPFSRSTTAASAMATASFCRSLRVRMIFRLRTVCCAGPSAPRRR